MRNEYRREMDKLGPRPEELERLYAMIEGGISMKKSKKLSVRAVVAIAACVVLMITAAAAAVPTVWETLTNHLGLFAPYAQSIEGVKSADQGIEIQVLSAISDDLEARVYLSVRDVEQDRLNKFLKLNGLLEAGESKDPKAHIPNEGAVVGGFSSSVFELVSYDPATKTALLSTAIYYLDSSRPNGEARLSVTGMSTREATLYPSGISCAAVTGETLDSLPAGKDDKVIFEPAWLEGGEADNSVLPGEHVVLAPGQTPMAIEGTEDMRISSMGFASDGCFHIRLEFADGVEPATYERTNFDWESGVNLTAGEICSQIYCDLLDGDGFGVKSYTIRETLVEGGMDILFPLITTEAVEDLQGWQARVYGTYLRPGIELEGDWSAVFELDYYPSVTLDWTGEAVGWQVRQVTVSPLSVTTHSTGFGQFHDAELRSAELYAVKKDGSTVAAKAGTSSYSNLDAAAEINGGTAEEPKGWEAFNTWRFEEPVNMEDIVSLKLGDATIPVS